MKKYYVIETRCEGTPDDPQFFHNNTALHGENLSQQDAIDLYHDELNSWKRAGGEVVETKTDDRFFKMSEAGRVISAIDIYEH
jgi:hypothetical protein